MRLIAIDTGTLLSACVLMDTETQLPIACVFDTNEVVREWIKNQGADEMCIEILCSYGLCGETVFTAQLFAGIFWGMGEMLGLKVTGYHRKVAVKSLAGHGNAGDSGVRNALIERYGYFEGNKGLGTKAKPGPIHMLSNCHLQAAACVALAHIDGAKPVDLHYSSSEEKKEKDIKKKEVRAKRDAKAAAKGSVVLEGKAEVMDKFIARGRKYRNK